MKELLLMPELPLHPRQGWRGRCLQTRSSDEYFVLFHGVDDHVLLVWQPGDRRVIGSKFAIVWVDRAHGGGPGTALPATWHSLSLAGGVQRPGATMLPSFTEAGSLSSDAHLRSSHELKDRQLDGLWLWLDSLDGQLE